jgi:hypothetical protein
MSKKTILARFSALSVQSLSATVGDFAPEKAAIGNFSFDIIGVAETPFSGNYGSGNERLSHWVPRPRMWAFQ